jgi:tetratricopeptide (TPR) repeat protein
MALKFSIRTGRLMSSGFFYHFLKGLILRQSANSLAKPYFRHMKPALSILFLIASLPLNGQQNLDSLFQKGMSALQAYHYQVAQTTFYECHRSDPNNPLYLEKLGYCYFQLGNLQEARTYLMALLKKDSVHVASLNYLATIEDQLLDYRSALGRVEALIRLDSTNAYYHKLSGQLNESLNNPTAAMLQYQRALQLNPSDQQSVITYCRLLTDAGYLPYADSLMETALRKQQKNLRLLYESVKLKYARKQFEQVLPKFETALAMGDTNLIYLPVYAFSLAQLERCNEALAWLHYLAVHKPPNEQLHFFMGRCYHHLDSLEQSFAQYDLAIQAAQSPNIAYYHQLMGDVTGQQKRYKLALKYYEQALENGNKDPVIYFNMAAAFDQLNAKDKKRAIEYYKKYLKNEDGKRLDLKQYAEKRVGELGYYEKHIWKGD